MTCLLKGLPLDSLVLFSCKITHSVISYLDRRGEDLEVLYEKCDWPTEFLRDPSCWLEADKMESLLQMIEADYGRGTHNDDSLITAVGHQCKDLRAWGVLDSVLRMVQTPKDLFAQPERFLSYFVSPAPPVGEMRRGPDFVSFVLPVSEMQFPLVTNYLRAALEALPTYINKPMANVRWDESRVHISWSEHQASLFGEAQSTELSLHPELVRNILMNLESSQRELEEMKKSLLAKEQEIEELKAVQKQAAPAAPVTESVDLSVLAQGVGQEITPPVAGVLNELYRIGDYMARGQQLITLLIGQGRQTPQVQEAMRRVDWSFVAGEGPKVIKRAIEGLQSVQETVRDLHWLADLKGQPKAKASGEGKQASDLNLLVDRAIANVQGRSSNPIQIDRHLLLDREVHVFPSRIEQAVTNLLSNAVDSLQAGGSVRISTRPKGTRAQIEIADNGRGWDENTLNWVKSSADSNAEGVFTSTSATPPRLGLAVAQSIIKLHDGSMTVTSQAGHGATVLVDLPLT